MSLKWFAKIALLSAAVVTLSGCSAANQPAEVVPLLVIGSTGGMCAEGPCGSSFTIYSDGSTSDDELSFKAEPIVSAIKQSKLRDLPEDPEAFCQSFVDGTDLTIEVPSWGEEVYTVCRLKDGAEDSLSIVAQDLLYRLNREIT